MLENLLPCAIPVSLCFICIQLIFLVFRTWKESYWHEVHCRTPSSPLFTYWHVPKYCLNMLPKDNQHPFFPLLQSSLPLHPSCPHSFTHTLPSTVELVDSQVLLKGCESQGYVILSAAKSQIHQQIHRPVWQDHSLVTKTTWIGSLQCMQYYATVSAGDKETQMGGCGGVGVLIGVVQGL